MLLLVTVFITGTESKLEEHPTVTYSLCFDQLWISVVAAAAKRSFSGEGRAKLLWCGWKDK